MFGALQILGALLVLAPYAMLQLGRLRSDSALYLWPNLLGAALLAVLALIGNQWGFLLLEGCWALVAARGLVSRGI
jgi:hypothetical protein